MVQGEDLMASYPVELDTQRPRLRRVLEPELATTTLAEDELNGVPHSSQAGASVEEVESRKVVELSKENVSVLVEDLSPPEPAEESTTTGTGHSDPATVQGNVAPGAPAEQKGPKISLACTTETGLLAEIEALKKESRHLSRLLANTLEAVRTIHDQEGEKGTSEDASLPEIKALLEETVVHAFHHLWLIERWNGTHKTVEEHEEPSATPAEEALAAMDTPLPHTDTIAKGAPNEDKVIETARAAIRAALLEEDDPPELPNWSFGRAAGREQEDQVAVAAWQARMASDAQERGLETSWGALVPQGVASANATRVALVGLTVIALVASVLLAMQAGL